MSDLEKLDKIFHDTTLDFDDRIDARLAFNSEVGRLYRSGDLVPRAVLDEATMQWANALANLRQGQSDTPRCEPPSDYAIERAFNDIKDVLRARAFLAKHGGGDAQG